MKHSPRQAEVVRETAETQITARLKLDGQGQVTVSTGLPFLDHMITALCRHAGFDLSRGIRQGCPLSMFL